MEECVLGPEDRHKQEQKPFTKREKEGALTGGKKTINESKTQ